MKTEAPEILSSLAFFGLSEQIILIEQEDHKDVLLAPFADKNIIIFTPQWSEIPAKEDPEWNYTAIVRCGSISDIAPMLKHIASNPNSDVKWDFIIIHAVDFMNIDLPKKARGAQIKAYISMLCSPKILRGANLIVTSTKEEYMLRDLADKFINQKIVCH